jgi:hypothetical protein
MTDTPRDPHPDSSPASNNDIRTDIEQAVDGRNDDIEQVTGEKAETPLEPTGVPDGVAGTGGVVKNQDDTAQ